MTTLNKHFTLPFTPHDFQEEGIAQIVKRRCSLLKYSVGLGKTLTATCAALQLSLDKGVEQILILCPPILMDQWAEWLQSVKGIPDVLVYRGTPTERAAMDLDTSVIICSYNVFRGTKKLTADHSRFKALAKKRKLCIIADELSLKNLSSQTYRKLKMMLYGKMRTVAGDVSAHYLIALNATPVSDLGQIYNWLAMMQPGTYVSKNLFEFAHVAKSDHWGAVLEWRNEDLLSDNFSTICVDTDKEIKLPPLVETVIPYILGKKHLKLYEEVKEAELNNLPEDKIELAINSMFSTLQRLVLLPREFGLDIESPVLDFIYGYLDQMSPDAGVLIYTRHVLVSQMLAEKIPDSVAIYGGVPKNYREEAFSKLKSGECKRLVGNIESLGVGLNLPMLNHVIYVELPYRDDKLIQSTGRIHRQGQQKTCFAVYPLAKETIQQQIYYKLLKNQEDLFKYLRSKTDIAEFLK